MKKVVSIVLTVAVMLTLVACAGQDGASALKTYVESDEFRTELDKQTAEYKEQGLDLDVKVEGDTLIYVCRFAEQLDNSGNTYGAALDSALAAQASTYENIASQLKTELNIASPVVRVEFLNADGTVLSSRDFVAK